MFKSSFISISFRRKLKADISTAFPILSAEQISELIPNKEELNVVKIYTHKGDSVTLYVLHKNPIFFEVERKLYPTGTVPYMHAYMHTYSVCILCGQDSHNTVTSVARSDALDRSRTTTLPPSCSPQWQQQWCVV